MCGIAGFYSSQKCIPENSRELLDAMGSLLAHRGPDDSGLYISPHCGLSFRRLSIIDLESGHQPMVSADGKLVIVFNGEIYNFKEIRKELEKGGVVFRTHSDTEVILSGYKTWGEHILTKLRGMFAFVIYDLTANELFIARDHTGIKPFYYTFQSKYFIFASEIKSILHFPSVHAQTNMEALPKYLTFLWVPAPQTLFKDIFILEPGFKMRVGKSGLDKSRYWCSDLNHQNDSCSFEDWKQIVDAELLRIVEEQMISDVPLGAFLSGGVDSSAIVSYMNKISPNPVTTFTTGFNDEDLSQDVIRSDLEYARFAEKYLNIEYNELIVKPDVKNLLPKLTWHMDEPLSDPAAITTFLICQHSREKCKVMLSGVGGDELFGGYPRYLANQIAQKYQLIPATLRKFIKGFVETKISTGSASFVRNLKKFLKSADMPFEERYLGYLTYYSLKELKDLLAFDFDWEDIFQQHRMILSNYTSENRLQAMMNLDLFTFLPNLNLMYTDKMSSAASIEVRVPFLDHLFIEKMAQIPDNLKIRNGKRKYLFKKTCEMHLPKKIVWRKKAGFGAPIGAWIKGELREMMLDLLSEKTIKKRGYFNHALISIMIDDHVKGKEYYANQLWQLMTFELWHQIYIDK